LPEPAVDRPSKIRRPPNLVPMFPVISFIPFSACPHHGPIRRGSIFVCMVCHQSGQDHLPSLQLLPGDLPRPDRRRRPRTPDQLSRLRETRRQKRLRLFGPAVEAAS
jgi:hypothetical protein